MRPALLVLSLVVFGAPSPARACSMGWADLFSQADGATTIAVGRWIPGGVRVETALRPHQVPIREVRVRIGNTSCDPRPRRGQRLLVLVNGDGRLVAHYQSAIALRGGAEEAAMVDALRRWHALALAPDPTAQRAFLVDLATRSTGRVASDAAWYLSAAPALVGGTTARERASLVAALGPAERQRETALAMALARMHAPEAVPVLADRLAASEHPEDLASALELLTGHHEPPFVRGRTLQGGARALAARWRAWRGAVTVPGHDARTLARTICTAPDELSRIVATEACERVHRRPLGYGFWFWTQGVAGPYWATLAAQCEHGPPPPDGGGWVPPPAPVCAPPADAAP